MKILLGIIIVELVIVIYVLNWLSKHTAEIVNNLKKLVWISTPLEDRKDI